MLEVRDLAPKKLTPVFFPDFPTSTGPLDLDLELRSNYDKAKSLRDSILEDESVPANQKAQVMNTITTVLSQIVKTQSEMYSSQRIRDLEAVLISVMRQQPESLQDEFFLEYDKKLTANESL